MADEKQKSDSEVDGTNIDHVKKQRKIERGKLTRTLNLLKAQCSTAEKDPDVISNL